MKLIGYWRNNGSRTDICGPYSLLWPQETKHPVTVWTHVDVLQVQEVQDDAVPLPDDGRAQRSLDGAGEDGAEAHRYGRGADSLILRQAQLHNFCWFEANQSEQMKEAKWRKTRRTEKQAGFKSHLNVCADEVKLQPS